jgi:hypothetical protein
MTTKILMVCAMSALLGSACGGSAIPVTKVADSKATIRAAEEAGAKDSPQAALHLKLARDQLNQAQAQMNEDENERASLFLSQSQADAEVALALAHEAKERKATEVARLRLQELQQGK